jgi:hypothetical protein
MFTSKELIENIKKVYSDKEKYEMYKHICDFHNDSGEYIGDYFNLFIHERVENQPPKMYHIG